jgi:hypothetical protein
MQTTDYIYREGTTPNTRSVVSSKNKIYAPAAGTAQRLQIGAMTTFSVSESRAVDPIRSLGHGDTIAELVPSATEPISISVERTMMYLSNVYQAFGYNAGIDGIVRSLKHHRWPFDIKQEIVFSELVNGEVTSTPRATSAAPAVATATRFSDYTGQGIFALVTMYEACWMNDYSADYPAEGTAVAESVSIMVTDVYDPSIDDSAELGEFIDSGNDPFNEANIGSERFNG